MQDIELVSKDFVICDDPRVVSTALMDGSKENDKPVKSYRVAQILDNDTYGVGDRVIATGEGAKIKLRGNPVEYWMFDINAIVCKILED